MIDLYMHLDSFPTPYAGLSLTLVLWPYDEVEIELNRYEHGDFEMIEWKPCPDGPVYAIEFLRRADGRYECALTYTDTTEHFTFDYDADWQGYVSGFGYRNEGANITGISIDAYSITAG